jgi:hypothetical protein
MPVKILAKIQCFIEEKQDGTYVHRASIMLVDTWLGQELQAENQAVRDFLIGSPGKAPFVPPRGFPADASRYAVEQVTDPVQYDKKGRETTYVEPVGDGKHWRLVLLRGLKEGPVYGWLTLAELEEIYRLAGSQHTTLRIALERMRTLNEPRLLFWTWTEV